MLTDATDKALSIPELTMVADGTTRLTVGMDLLTLQARGDLPDSLAGFRDGLLNRFKGMQSKKGEPVPLSQLSQGLSRMQEGQIAIMTARCPRTS